MSIIQQLVQLLTQSPDSIIYYVIILLALQATFGLALWQFRRDPEDRFARRLVLASAAIFLSHLIFALVVLWFGNQGDIAAILPPLESGLDGISVTFLVWALAPQPSRNQRLGSIILFLVLLAIGFMYVTLASQWSLQLSTGATTSGYLNSRQADYWAIFLMVLLGIGAIVTSIGRPKHWGLRLTILGLLVVAYMAGLLFTPDFLPDTINIPVWVRLGNLVVFPLLAVLAYQHNLGQILPGKIPDWTAIFSPIEQLKITRSLLDSPGDLPATLHNALAIVNHFYDLPFSALAVRSENDPNYLLIQSSGAATTGSNREMSGEQQAWAIKLSDWPAIKLAMQQQRQVELLPDGLGARQLYNFYQEMNISESGALLIEPLFTENDDYGVMLLAKSTSQSPWTAKERALSVAMGALLARAIANSLDYAQSDGQGLSTTVKRLREELITAVDVREKAIGEVKSLTDQLHLVKEELAAESKKVQELRAIVDAAGPLADETIKALEQKVHTLSESLADADNTLALVAAGESGLSTDWVMHTVSRYSGELEDAQVQINHLEAKLSWQQEAEAYSLLTRRVHELRTPLTSIGGYTDILLSESSGKLDAQQITLLMRMKNNVEQIGAKLDHIARSAAQVRMSRPSQQRIEVRETIEAAVHAVSNQLRVKRLRLDLDLASDLPLVASEGDAFYQIVSHLLNNACQVSEADGKLGITAQQDAIQEPSPDGNPEALRFLRLTIADSGGSRSQDIHSLISHSRQGIGEQHKQARLSLSRHSLAAATALVVAQGGRTWVEPNDNRGSTFSILLPLASNGTSDKV